MGVADSSNVIQVDFGKRHKGSEKSGQKLAVFQEYLEQGITMLILDARHEGVLVPRQFADCPDLRLNFAFEYRIEDFSFDFQAVRATLSFDEGFYFCEIPWDAVFAVQSEGLRQGKVWPEDIPPELLIEEKVPKAAPKLLQLVDEDYSA